MPLLNDADDVMVGTVRADRVYLGNTLVWPREELWSAWMEVQAVQGAAPSAWFNSGIEHYDTGSHQRVMWRYSLNTKRVQITGLARATRAFAYGEAVMWFDVSTAIIPKATTAQMSHGIASPDTTALWGGSFMRYDVNAHASVHSTVSVLYQGTTFPGGWLEFDCTYSFGEET